MVKEINGGGEYITNVLDAHGLGLGTPYRVARRPKEREQELDGMLRGIKADPSIDERSFRVSSVFDRGGYELIALVVPAEAPMYDYDTHTAFRRNPYKVNAWDKSNPDRKQLESLETAKDGSSARGQARRWLTRSGLNPDDYAIEATQLSAQEAIHLGKKLIDEGVKLPSYLLKFGGLYEYNRAYQARVASSS